MTHSNNSIISLIEKAKAAEAAAKAAIAANHQVSVEGMVINRRSAEGQMFLSEVDAVAVVRKPIAAKMEGGLDLLFQKKVDALALAIKEYDDQNRVVNSVNAEIGKLNKRPLAIKAEKRELQRAIDTIDALYTKELVDALKSLIIEENAIPLMVKDLEERRAHELKTFSSLYWRVKNTINAFHKDGYFTLYEIPEFIQDFIRKDEARKASKEHRAAKRAAEEAAKKAKAAKQEEVAKVLASVKAPKVGANITIKAA